MCSRNILSITTSWPTRLARTPMRRQYHLNTFYRICGGGDSSGRPAHFSPCVRRVLDAACSFPGGARCSISYASPLAGSDRGGSKRSTGYEHRPRRAASRLDGTLGGVPLSLRIQNQLHPVSPDDFSYLLHRITLGTEAGELTLVTTHGPLLWCGRPAVPREVLNPHETRPYSSEDFQTDDVATMLLSPAEASSQRRLFREDWPAAARRAVHELCVAIDEERDSLHRGQHHLTLCRMWQQMTGALGAPDLLKSDVLPRPLAPAELGGIRMAADDGHASDALDL